MKRFATALAILALALTAGAAWAAGPIASPDQPLGDAVREAAPPAADKALGDPTDWLASCLAGADYLVYMAADITEDNAGNGDPDPDLEDGGWDWATTAFEHGASASPNNIYGATAAGLVQAYLLDPTLARFTAMKDAADNIVAEGPTVIRTGSDILFLCDFADLPGVADPSIYRAAAVAIWNDRVTVNGGGTAAGIAEYIRDGRFGQGYSNGIIPWDCSFYALAAARLHEVFPLGGYDTAAIDIAEIMWEDSFNANPGYFDPYGVNQGWDPTGATSDYWWYTIGVSGLIRAFDAAGVHTAEIPGLVTLLLDSQYSDGAFSDSYGAPTDENNRDWQDTAYCVMALFESVPPTSTTLESVRGGATWLASTQDLSGAWVYSSGNHYPEVGGECTVAAAYGWLAAGAAIGATVDGIDPVSCDVVKTVTVGYTPGDASLGLRGYEIVFQVTGGVVYDLDDVYEGTAFDGFSNTFYYEVDEGAGVYSINGSILGATTGLLTAGDLFTVELTTDTAGPVEFEILSYDLRDPENTPIFADISGVSFTIDCTAGNAVTDITAAPAHEKVAVSWDHDGLDVAEYVVFRGLWYDTTVGNSAYPEYDDLLGDVIPTRPADYAAAMASTEWDSAGAVPAGTFTFTDSGMTTGRGVYYYEVFAVDAALNGSDAAAANDRATNYWLGDIDGDGYVDVIGDITPLGNAFGTCEGDIEGNYNNLCDVGPTDDWSAVGIPTTDSCIDFEDLIVFAINYGVVTDAKVLPAIDNTVNLAWTRLDETHYALQLTGGNGLLGLRLEAPAAVRGVSAGELLANQDDPMFLRNLGSALDANLAVMGGGITGTGNLLIVTTDREIAAGDLTITARGLDNSEIMVSFSEPSGPALPSVFALEANYPNPFNPQTTIGFALPRDEDVRLAVYGVDGRLVRVLVNEHRDAGQHHVIWRGDDAAGRRVATGTYFYIIDAGAFHQVRKMSLVK